MQKKKNKNKIPKIIHYCWFGNNPKSDLILKCIASWKKFCPDYEIIEWNESNFDININDYVREAYYMKKYAFVSDYARLWVIYNYGGIYLDTDVELISNIDQVLEYNAFFSSEDNIFINTGLGFGSVKENKIVKEIMDDYKGIHFIKDDNSIDKTTCPVRNTAKLMEIIDNICFFPRDYFCPLDYKTRKMNKTENTLAIHWFNGSWMTKTDKIKYFVKKVLIKLKILK